jgi:hypothetical protein
LEETVTEKRALPLRAAYTFGVENGLEKEIEAIKDIEIDWDLPYTSSLRKGYLVELFENQSIFEKFKTAHWQFGNTPQGEREWRRYLRLKQRYEDFLQGRGTESEAEAEVAGDIDESQSFAAETDLRDFLAKNPARIEAGLTVYRDGDRSGVEYSIDDGRIDILAVDRDKRFVVIELKVGRGRSKTIGQLLYYMGWVDKNLANGKSCRGIIIAKEIPDDLILAVGRVPGVTLCRYDLSVTIETVAAKA